MEKCNFGVSLRLLMWWLWLTSISCDRYYFLLTDVYTFLITNTLRMFMWKKHSFVKKYLVIGCVCGCRFLKCVMLQISRTDWLWTLVSYLTTIAVVSDDTVSYLRMRNMLWSISAQGGTSSLFLVINYFTLICVFYFCLIFRIICCLV